MFNDSAAVERVRRGGTHSSNTAKLVNMDVWYATTLWLALLSGWIDPSSGRRTRKNPTGGILMKPIMPPALLTPQTLDDSYYYDQGAPPIPHPAIPSNYPFQSSAFDSSPPGARLWRSINDPAQQTRPSKDNPRQFQPPQFPPQKSQQGRSNMPSQRFPPNFQFHPSMRGMGPPNKPIPSRPDFEHRDLNEDSPFNPGNQFPNRNPFNQGNPFNKNNPFNDNPFNKGDSFNQDNPFSEGDPPPEFGFGPTREWSGRQRRQPPRLPPPSMDNPWEPLARYGSMRRQSPKVQGNIGMREDRQGQNFNPLDDSDSMSEEHVNMLPRQRNKLAISRSMIPYQQAINSQYPRGPMNQRFQQRPLPPMQQYGLDNPDYFENRHVPKVANRPLKLRNGNKQPRPPIADIEDVSGNGNVATGLLKIPNLEKQIKTKETPAQQEDEFVVESEENSNTTGKPIEAPVKETKSSEGSDESKNAEDSGSSEESTTKKASHKSKSTHEHKHKDVVAVVTEADENTTKHVHGHNHHSSKAKAKSEESLSDEKDLGLPKKRRPRTTLATDFIVEEKKEVAEKPGVVDIKQN